MAGLLDNALNPNINPYMTGGQNAPGLLIQDYYLGNTGKRPEMQALNEYRQAIGAPVRQPRMAAPQFGTVDMSGLAVPDSPQSQFTPEELQQLISSFPGQNIFVGTPNLYGQVGNIDASRIPANIAQPLDETYNQLNPFTNPDGTPRTNYGPGLLDLSGAQAWANQPQGGTQTGVSSVEEKVGLLGDQAVGGQPQPAQPPAPQPQQPQGLLPGAIGGSAQLPGQQPQQPAPQPEAQQPAAPSFSGWAGSFLNSAAESGVPAHALRNWNEILGGHARRLADTARSSGFNRGTETTISWGDQKYKVKLSADPRGVVTVKNYERV